MEPGGRLGLRVGESQPRGDPSGHAAVASLGERGQRLRQAGFVEGVDDPRRFEVAFASVVRRAGAGGHFDEHLAGQAGIEQQLERAAAA
ncbi:MAG: hypothetical protein ACK56I_09900, partial [bacterium]